MKPVEVNPPDSVPGRAVVLGREQPEYQALAAWRLDDELGTIVTRWQLTPEDRAAIAAGADVYITLLTFDQPLQPIAVALDPKEILERWG